MRVTILWFCAAGAYGAGGLLPLFDGKTLNGPNSFLGTGRNYANFVLELDEKNGPERNGGIQILSHQYGE